MNQLITAEQVEKELQQVQEMCKKLMATPHYQKFGPVGCFAIVEKARSIGVNPLGALNGGMYYVNGKVELCASMMNELIREKKHSITQDRRSNNEICILHGKRADNGDTWTESFSIEEAKIAGIYKQGGPWTKYPRDMLFARALSRLARQLFPDVIKGCYVDGEIAASIEAETTPIPPPPTPAPTPTPRISVVEDESISESKPEQNETQPEPELRRISKKQYQELERWLGENTDLRKNLEVHLFKNYNKETDLSKMPLKMYKRALEAAKRRCIQAQQQYGEQLQAVGA